MSVFGLKYIRGQINSHQYLDVVLSKADLSEITNGCDGLAEEIRSVIITAFWRLDELDRNDPFWIPGNGLPTIAKLDEFSKYQIRRGVDIEFWSWLDICISYFHFSSFLDVTLWGAIKKVNVQWLVRTSWNYHHFSGSESAGNLAVVLNSLAIENEVSLELGKIAKLSKKSEGWVSNVKACLFKP
jgi:hypothetical protein